MTLVVLMAGGKGQRLHPLTEHVPKPMLQVGQKPMLETVLDGFKEQGFKRFVFTVCYRQEVIKRYFGDGTRFGVEIDYIREDEPLGTAGALGLLPPQTEPIIVQNGDVIVKMDYRKLLAEHFTYRPAATMAVALYQHQVPYGVAEIDSCFVLGTQEKPILSWLVNSGIYVVSPEVLPTIRGRVDMPDVLKTAGLVRYYRIEGYWMDVGRFEDLARANGED